MDPNETNSGSLFFAFVPGVFSEEQPGEHDKSDHDADDRQPSSDLIHKSMSL